MTIKASNFPTTRPTLDLNFAATKRLDPRVTFSRASAGTYVDGNGVLQSAATNVPRFDHNPTTGESLGLLVEEARTNSRRYSNTFSDGSYIKGYFLGTALGRSLVTPGQSDSPLGPGTGWKLEPDPSGSASYLSTTRLEVWSDFIPSGNTKVLSIFAKAGTAGTTLTLHPANDGHDQSTFNLESGTVVSGPGSIQNYGNGWYRCSVASSVNVTSGRNFQIHAVCSTYSDFIYIAGCQFESGAFPTSYIPTPATFTGRSSTATYYDANGIIQTAGSGVARSNAYFPDSNGVMRPVGLLLEAASTNSYTYSNDLTQSVYSKNNVTLSVNAAIAPDGTNTATKVIPTTDSVVHSISRLGTLGLSSMRSVYVKAAGYTSCTVHDINTGSRATINLITGEITNAEYFNFDIYNQARGRVRNVGNGWWRIEVGYDSYSATNNPFHIYPNNNSTFVGDGTSGILVWGYQQEANVYPQPTSYIPTTTSTVTRAADTSTSATVTRSADVAQITGANFSSWYNPSAGTWLGQVSAAYATTQRLFEVGNSSSNQTSVSVRPGPTSTTFARQASGASSVNHSYPAKFAVADSVANIQGCVNGTLASLVSTGTSVTDDKLALGASMGGSNSANSIARLTYWPTRLPDATLQTITQ